MQNVLNLKFDTLPSQQHHGFFEISATSRPSPLLLSRTQIHLPVICARKAKRVSGHQKVAEILPKLAFSMASNLSLLPEPLSLILAELSTSGCGGGGGSRSWKGFGGGSGEGWGRRKRGKGNFVILLGLLLASGVAILLFSSGKADKDLIIGVLASALISAVLLEGFGRGARDCLLGFCIFGVGVTLGSRRDDLQKLAQKQGFTCPSVLHLAKGRGIIRRRRTSKLW
ncbi:unnamed protein product [Linum trigynum]|uniref:Uncharacterized protein n=1 Tax=Linum trigynum TaxID=586398 RepID=A0AAV2DU73_9ROSI